MPAAHIHTPWGCHWTPAIVRWWSESVPDYRGDGTLYSHVMVLRHLVMGRSADDMEALAHCFTRVVYEGARSSSGRWCVCLSESAGSAGEARGSVGSDGFSGLLGVLTDLESAADALPIAWKSTERIFKAQGRSAVYGARLTYFLRNLRVREIDRWSEPRDPNTGRPRSTSLAFFMMALQLGGAKTECRWPRKLFVVEREVAQVAA